MKISKEDILVLRDIINEFRIFIKNKYFKFNDIDNKANLEVSKMNIPRSESKIKFLELKNELIDQKMSEYTKNLDKFEIMINKNWKLKEDDKLQIMKTSDNKNSK